MLPPRDAIININEIGDTDFCELFRFDSTSMRTILSRLPFDNDLRTRGCDRYHLAEGFCLICIRLAYACRWHNLSFVCRRHSSAMSRIFWDLVARLLHRVKANILLAHEDPDRWLGYRQAFIAKGSPPELHIAGALDAKQLRVCRPVQGQRSVYTGHKQEHCFKFQTVVVPDGLIVHSTAAHSGRDHDARVMRDSGLLDRWNASPVLMNFNLVADSAYPNRNGVVSLYTQVQRQNHIHCAAFNHRMSPLRQPVEWGYGRMMKLWGFLNTTEQMRSGVVSVSDLWLLSVWLTNLVTCAEGRNIISDYYGTMKPPTLEEYLDMTLN